MKIRPKPAVTRCSACTLLEKPYCPPWLPPTSDLPILWVGQGPGRTEGVTGIPFTGKAGKMLFSLMMNAGVNKNKQRITNIIGCVSIDDKGEDKPPSVLEISCCHQRLVDEIHLVQPKLIVAFGKPAMQALTGVSASIKEARSQVYPLKAEFNYHCPVFICLHPSFVMRQRQWIEIAIKDIQAAVDYVYKVDKEVKQENSTSAVINITSSHEQPHFISMPSASELSNYLSERSKTNISFDLETYSPDPNNTDLALNPRRGVIGACGFSDGSSAVVFKFDDWQCREVAKKYLEDTNALKSTQNGSFDCAFLFNNNISVKGLTYDTRLAEHLLNSDLPTDLQFLRKQYTSIPPYKRSKKELKKAITSGGQVTDVECCWDALTTNRVMQQQSKLLTKGHWKVLENIYMPLVFTLNDMSHKGIKVDVSALLTIFSRLEPVATKIYEEWFKPIGINPRSPQQLKKLWGIESTNDKVIKALINKGHRDRERMIALVDYREIITQTARVLKGTYKRLEDSYVHTDFRPEGTGTGRISSKNPALQNIRKYFRVIFISDDEDHVLVQADYSQLELVVAAILGKEENLLHQIKTGIKPHHVLGKVIYGRDWADLNDQERRREKAVLFGTMGGRGARSIAIEYGIPISTAKEWQDKCVSTYPGLLRYQQDCMHAFNTTGKITTAFGTERKVSTPTQAMNNRFQGSASFVTLTTLNLMHAAGFDLRLTVHDSIIWQCRKEDVVDSVREAKKIIERPIPELDNWCFKCEAEYGRNWAEMEVVG